MPIVLIFLYPLKRYKKVYILSLFFLYSFFLLLRGYLSDNWIKYIFTDFLTVLSFFYCYTFFDSDSLEEDFLKFINVASSWLLIGLPLSWYFIIKLGLQPSIELGARAVITNNTGGSVPDYLIRTPIEFSFFLVLFIPYIKNRLKIIVILSLITYFIYGIFTATRTPVLLSLAGLIVSFVLNKKYIHRKIFLIVSVISLISVISVINFFSFEKVKLAINNSYVRLTGSGLVSSRDEEKNLYLDSITPAELWAGKGLGASNKTGMWKKYPLGIAMIHRGDINLIMKGGIILLVIFILIVSTSLLTLYRNRHFGKYLIAIMVFYLLFELGHTLWGNFIMQIFLFLSISFARISTREKEEYDEAYSSVE